nr:hypothetical protein [Salmonella enterica]
DFILFTQCGNNHVSLYCRMVYTISVYVIINKIISFICCKIIIISYIGSIIRLNVNFASYFCIIKMAL